MNTELAVLRLRTALDRWFVPVVTILLLLSLLGGYGVYSSLAAEPATETESVEAWSTTGGFSHGAEVTQANELYEIGTELTDRPAYFSAVSPVLAGEFTTSYAAHDGSLDVDIELERQLRGIEETPDERLEHWEDVETLARVTESEVQPGAETAVPFEMHVPDVVNESAAIQESLGTTPGEDELTLVATVTLTGTVEGEPVETTERYELTIEDGDERYAVDGPSAEERIEERTETVPADDDSGPPLGAAVLLVTPLATLGAVTGARATDRLAPPPATRDRIRTAAVREQYDEWISRGSLMPGLQVANRVEVERLEDLVDVAIDCQSRVIETESGYFVVDGDTFYGYVPPGASTSDTD